MEIGVNRRVCVADLSNRRGGRNGVEEGDGVSLETPAKSGNNGCMVIPMTVTHACSRQ